MNLKYFIILLTLTQILWSQRIIEREITDWEFRMVGDSVWKNAKVPGTIIDNFVDLNDISNPLHPYYGNNEKLYQWIGEKDWEFRTTINIDDEYLTNGYMRVLEFGCLDVIADIYINGEKYAYHTNNAFVKREIMGLNYSSNEVKIVFHSTQNSAMNLVEKNTIKLPGGERVFIRTPQYQFGWDWAPKFVNMGIRKPVSLRILPNNSVHIQPPYVNFSTSKNNKIDAGFDISISSELKYFDVNLMLYQNGEKVDSFVIEKYNVANGYMHFPLRNPSLWWPNGSGRKSNYYEVDVKITLPDSNNVIAEEKFTFALCKIKLVKKKDKIGESFYFTVNGERIFIKGANYVPDDSFHPGKNSHGMIQLAKNANMNMLRVWGGGTYPEDEFYIECLKNGIMIWQDYMFACAMYPGDSAFLSNVEDEVFYQTDRLENKNNIAVWCGNNENEEGWKNWGWQKEFTYSSEDSTKIWHDYLKLNDTILRFPNGHYQVIPAYVSTSPKVGWGRKESMTEGDSHYWGVWWGLEPIENYPKKIPRFMSEFGMQSMPDMRLLSKVIPDSAMNFNSPLFKNHQKHPTGFETLNHYLKEYFAIPVNMVEYSYATQVLQAYSLQTAIESQRTHMPYCMGSLIWQLNDCWPVTSWSIIDYELNRKIAYYKVKKSFMPVIVTMEETQTTYNFYVVNDMLQKHGDELVIYISNFDGERSFEKIIPIQIKSQTSSRVFSIKKQMLTNYKLDEIYIHAELKSDLNTRKNFHLVKPNQLKLKIPEINVYQDERGKFYIKSNTYCPYMWLPGYENQPGVTMSDLEANQEIGILVTEDNITWLKWLETHPEEILCLNKLLQPRAQR